MTGTLSPAGRRVLRRAAATLGGYARPTCFLPTIAANVLRKLEAAGYITHGATPVITAAGRAALKGAAS